MKYLLSFLFITVVLQTNAQQDICKRISEFEKSSNKRKFDSHLLSNASPDYTVYYYRCEWKVDPAALYITGKVTPYYKIISATNSIVLDLTNQLVVDSVCRHNKKLAFSQNGNETLVINFSFSYPENYKDSVSIFYHGVPAGGSFGSFSQTTHNGVNVIWTLSEPYGAKDWWPCRNGLDDKADSINILISYPANANYRASSNGLLQSTKTVNGFTTSYYKHRYPIASYLVAIAVTNYSVFTQNVKIGSAILPVISYIYPEDLAAFKANNYIVLTALNYYSQLFGDYPFLKERYGQTEFSWGGGMEHQTNSFVINDGTILMTHELSHQWFGDKITCGSWHDIWLNEGFATYISEILYTAKFNPSQLQTNIANELSSIVSQPNGSVWVDDTTNVNRIFDDRLSYNKGSFLLRMLRWTLGDSAFFNALKAYQSDPKLAYGFAFTSDLQHHFELSSGTNLDYFFAQWYYGQGYPSFTVNWSQDKDNNISFTVNETTLDTSVLFYKVLLPVTVKNATQQRQLKLLIDKNNISFTQHVNFIVDSVLVDPGQQLISANNKSIYVPGQYFISDAPAEELYKLRDQEVRQMVK